MCGLREGGSGIFEPRERALTGLEGSPSGDSDAALLKKYMSAGRRREYAQATYLGNEVGRDAPEKFGLHASRAPTLSDEFPIAGKNQR